VVLTGSGFTGVTAVSFGETAATTFTVNGEDRITATAPAGAGTVPITVTGPEGASAVTDLARFTYEPETDPLPPTEQTPQPPPGTAATAAAPPQEPGSATDPAVRKAPPEDS
jgi:hypothetical protein